MKFITSLILLVAFASLFAFAMGDSSMTGDSYWKKVAGDTKYPAGKTRNYYIQSDELEWDYTPLGYNGYTGKAFGDDENVYVKEGPGHPGSKYIKCLYRGYTDKTYTKLQSRPAEDAYLGMMGPTVRAEVGDVIKVYFSNKCSIPVSVHVHGVFYQKDSEGAEYDDGTSGNAKLDDAVAPNGTWIYTWQVPERAGPGPHDGSSVMWMYHSHVNDVGDIYAGMMGNMVITGRGLARADGTPKDVDREIFATFSVQDESNSPYFAKNVAKYALPGGPAFPNPFAPENQMHAINGYLYGSQPLMQMHKKDRVRWYVMGMGGFFDMHTPHWHGNTVVMNGMRMDVINLLPFSMVVVDMVPDAVGIWFFHCHVVTHMEAGMMTRYEVLP